MRNLTTLYSEDEVASWYTPDLQTIQPEHQPLFQKKCAALRAVSLGEVNLTQAAKQMGVCRKRLREMQERAPRLAPDGAAWGFRVCVPWGSYDRQQEVADGQMPRCAGPHSMAAVLAAQPHIGERIHSFNTPLPPGRAPNKFLRLHEWMVKELKKLSLHDYYPLNQKDQGKRALLRYIRNRRIETAPMPIIDGFDDGAAPTRLKDIFNEQEFDRMELDGHRIDAPGLLQVPTPNGGSVTRKVSALWWIPEIECTSHAIVSWTLRVGRNYNNQDVTQVLAGSMQPWEPLDLVIPGLEYAADAGMPSSLEGPLGFSRGVMVAVDNHKGHHYFAVEEAFCRSHDGILTLGRPHEPRTRPVVEQLNSRIEKGAFRMLPGGFEPPTKLGTKACKVSTLSPEDHPLQLPLLVELINVIVANYNATPHPALGDLSPLQYLKQRAKQDLWLYQPRDRETCAADMNSVIVRLLVHGNKKTGVLPHVNYAYVRYRSPELDNSWELIGKHVTTRVSRGDLRSMIIFRTATKPIGIVRATAPWAKTKHDETTRKMINQWSKQEGGLSLKGVDCAIEAYTKFLRKIFGTSQQAVDQLARLQQMKTMTATVPSLRSMMQTPLRTPKRGLVSMDDMRDC